jgi:hypothetical protein
LMMGLVLGSAWDLPVFTAPESTTADDHAIPAIGSQVWNMCFRHNAS